MLSGTGPGTAKRPRIDHAPANVQVLVIADEDFGSHFLSTAMTKTKVLVTGATGYIGGSVLDRFLARPDADNFEFTVLVRDPKKAEKFKTLGVDAVVGSHSDAPLMAKLSSEADVVIATVHCFRKSVVLSLHISRLTATISSRPMQRWPDSRTDSKKLEYRPFLSIRRVSGTGVIAEDSKGLSASELIYDDADAAQMASIPDTAIHRNVDLAITNADAEGYIKSYIILPSTIYGLASGRFVDAGLQSAHSQQIPALIKSSLDRGHAGMVGEGKNLWPNVEIHELSELYSVLWDAIVSNSGLGHGREGYFFGASGEHSLYEVGKAIGEVLVALGKSDDPAPTTFTKPELDKYFGGADYLGSNSRCHATHSRSIGWKPVKSTSDMLASIQLEIEAILKK
ncbi:hypothetical protein MIND_00164300 [Mycena indigotica]|uniref:NmrA-like domain-containing protein n=1 Tax=Mycena indigotica TaxID=2126181 RepID=A0A8H6TD84_9AGAR|nr:uncharacterized protein MIND_00164300 [Mycena indigotica]KAF7316453.1 hypothetical protein MIND_00164300 [Mycena indigotica]